MPSSITLTVTNLAQSTSFFLSALQPIGYAYRGRVNNAIGFGPPDAPADFWIEQSTPSVPAGAAHVAFPATSREKVHDFFYAALKAGGKVHDEPHLRDSNRGYYSAAVIDLDGNSIEAVHRHDPRISNRSDTSQPSSISGADSVVSKAKSTASKPLAAVSKAKTARWRTDTSTQVRSVASSSVSNPPNRTSKATTSASRAPTSVSRTSSQQQNTPDNTSAIKSRNTSPSDGLGTIISDAKGAITVAQQLMQHVRPSVNTSISTPNVSAPSKPPPATPDPTSHKASDTIVGTLLGVAAGAALTYAYSKVTEPSRSKDLETELALLRAQLSQSRPLSIRALTASESESVFPRFQNDRQYYYHDHLLVQGTQPYAIESPPSVTTAARATEYHPARSRKMITLVDADERLSTYRRTTTPRCRSSLSAIDADAKTTASRTRASQTPAQTALFTPPSSYRNPTVATQLDGSHVSLKSRSTSRSKSNPAVASDHSRATSVSSSSPSPSRRTAASGSGTDEKNNNGSSISSKASTIKPSRPIATSTSATTTSASRTNPTSSSRTSSRSHSRSRSHVDPRTYPLPASRAGTAIEKTRPSAGSETNSAFRSTHSRANRTVIGRVTGREWELTRSVVGKIQGLDEVRVTAREVEPSDSVSQAGSRR